MEDCTHEAILYDPSPHVRESHYSRPSARQRIIAAERTGSSEEQRMLVTNTGLFNNSAAFPAPLVLPDDDLADDPEPWPQTFMDWREERNEVTEDRRTIYLVNGPAVHDSVHHLRRWSHVGDGKKTGIEAMSLDIQDLKTYTGAFYYGMKTSVSSLEFEWRAWDEGKGKAYDGAPLKSGTQRRLVGLKTPSDELIGIRCRKSPDGVSRMQVNLDDVLDALAENIPKDAYAVLMVMDLDMYENDDGEEIFTGGRAYGGSRIAVVSTFRDRLFIGDGHSWPSSHCAAYVSSMCGRSIPKSKTSSGTAKSSQPGPMKKAVDAVGHLRKADQGRQVVGYVEWLSRVAQTITHELGHCFGLDHCVYFACTMQGCGSTAEALRQPPYLCPVCLEKLASAIGDTIVGEWNSAGHQHIISQKREFVKQRYQAIKSVCDGWIQAKPSSPMFTGHSAWIEGILELDK